MTPSIHYLYSGLEIPSRGIQPPLTLLATCPFITHVVTGWGNVSQRIQTLARVTPTIRMMTGWLKDSQNPQNDNPTRGSTFGIRGETCSVT